MGLGIYPGGWAQTPGWLPGLLVSYWVTCVKHVWCMGLVFSSVKWVWGVAMPPLRDGSDDQGETHAWLEALWHHSTSCPCQGTPRPSNTALDLLELVTRATGRHPWWLGLSEKRACSSYSHRTLLLGHSGPLTLPLRLPFQRSLGCPLPCTATSTSLSETDCPLRAPASAPLTSINLRTRDPGCTTCYFRVIGNPNSLGQSGFMSWS